MPGKTAPERIALAALAALLAIGAAPPIPHRIVSTNLCADQLLVALADRSQIAALTTLSRDPALSAVATVARKYPVSRGGAEDVLALRPDLVVAGFAAPRLPGRPVPALVLDNADSYAAIVRQVRDVARAVGHPARGEALVAKMDAALAHVPANGRGRIAAYYQRRGFLTGTGTLVDELMRRAGLVNLAARLGMPVLAQLPLERLVAAKPDLLVVEADSVPVNDEGTAMLAHPVLAGVPRVVLPQAWTVCGGPGYVLAAQSLAVQLQR